MLNNALIFEPIKIRTYEPNISLISLISLMFNSAKPRILGKNYIIKTFSKS